MSTLAVWVKARTRVKAHTREGRFVGAYEQERKQRDEEIARAFEDWTSGRAYIAGDRFRLKVFENYGTAIGPFTRRRVSAPWSRTVMHAPEFQTDGRFDSMKFHRAAQAARIR